MIPSVDRYRGVARGPPWIWCVAFFAIGISIYSAGLNIPRLGDDYDIVIDHPSENIHHFFANKNPNSRVYRPIEAAVSALVLSWDANSTWPIQVLQIAVHSMLSWWVCVVICGVGFSRLHAAIGGLFMVLSQANLFAVLSNDTLSQLGATQCGCWALWHLYRAHVSSTGKGTVAYNGNILSRARYAFAVIFTSLALLFKESGVSCVAMSVVLLAAIKYSANGPRQWWFAAARDAAPFVLVGGAYVVVRSYIVDPQPVFADLPMAFSFGMNIARNLTMLAFALLMPVSSEWSYRLLQNRDWLLFACVITATLAFAGLCLVGIRRVAYRRDVGMVLLLSIIALFPHALLGKIGELYAYNAMPYVAVLVGIAMGQLLASISSPSARRTLMVALVTLSISHIVAINIKSRQLKANGTKAVAMLKQLKSFAAEVPQNGKIWIRDVHPPVPGYSIYRMPGLSALPTDWKRNAELIGRADLEIRPMSPEQLKADPPIAGTLLLAVDADQLVRDK